MKKFKWLRAITIIVVVGFAALGFTLSHDSSCNVIPDSPDTANSMRAIVQSCYGGPDVLQVRDIAKPTPGNGEVLIKVHAAAANPLDWHYMRGTPYLIRLGLGIGTPKYQQLGVDVAGTVEAVGADVHEFKPGDEVFGLANGAYAQYALAWHDMLVTKPANVSFEQAAAVPIAGITALQFLRDKAHLKPGQKILINGASGGVGTFAVQIAKSMGAKVTGVCSTRNIEMVRSIGADHVIDYTKEDFTLSSQHYDVMLDNVSSRSLSDLTRVVTPNGIVMLNGGGSPDGNKWIGPFIPLVKAMVYKHFVDQQFERLFSSPNNPDLVILRAMLEAGTIKPVIDRTYPLSETAAAIRQVEAGHVSGKVIVLSQAL